MPKDFFFCAAQVSRRTIRSTAIQENTLKCTVFLNVL